MTVTLRFPCPLCGQDMTTLITLQGMSWTCPACHITINGITCNHCHVPLIYDGYNPTYYFFSCPTCPIKIKVTRTQLKDWLFRAKELTQQAKSPKN